MAEGGILVLFFVVGKAFSQSLLGVTLAVGSSHGVYPARMSLSSPSLLDVFIIKGSEFCPIFFAAVEIIVSLSSPFYLLRWPAHPTDHLESQSCWLIVGC